MKKLFAKILKPWGWEEILEKNNEYVVKKIFIRKGHRCSKQYHEYKKETIMVLVGSLIIEFGNNDYSNILHMLEHLTISPKVVHRMVGKTDCTFLECSTPQLDDVVRLEDDYGRNKSKRLTINNLKYEEL